MCSIYIQIIKEVTCEAQSQKRNFWRGSCVKFNCGGEYTYAPPAKGSKAKLRKESKNKEFDHRFEKGKSAYMKLIQLIS